MKQLAKGLASLGRGEDTMLVHMTPREVAGLQQMAVASGGSLTINPHTGLPEAGWLSSLLPMLAGSIATVMTGGAAAPLIAGGLTGAVTSKIEGGNPLMGGLMGLMGGWGGGGVAKGLMGAGQAAAGAAGTAPAAVPAGFEKLMAPVTAQSPALTPALAPSAALKAGAADLLRPGGATPVGLWKGLTTPEKFGLGIGTLGTLQGIDAASRPKKGKDEGPLYYQSGPASIDPVTGRTTFAPGQWSRQFDYGRMGTYEPGRAPWTLRASKREEEELRKRYGYAEGGYTDDLDMYKNLAVAPVNSYEFQRYLSGD